MNKKIVWTLLIVISLISLYFNVYKQAQIPPCINADEAAFGYNAYSLLKTGKDEYGQTFPLRLKSFGDYKMPLYSYFSIPFISIFGLNEEGARALNNFIALLFPVAVFFLAKEIFKENRVSLIAAFLTAVSLGLHIVGRHAHEAYLTAFLVTVSLIFLIRVLRSQTKINYLAFFLSLSLSLFSYHSSRLFAVLFFIIGVAGIPLKKLRSYSFLAIFIIIIGGFIFTDINNNPTRVKNLLFFNNQGFHLNIQQLKTEGGIKILYNEYFQGIKEIAYQHLNYYSPQFLIIKGDDNPRFGSRNVSIMTPIEYVLIVVGLSYLFYKKQPWRYLILSLFLLAPLTASLSWADISLTRSLFFLIPCILIASYGASNLTALIRKNNAYLLGSFFILLAFLFFLISGWDFYLFHYPKKALTLRSWQCGYQELSEYIKNNYSKFDKFYITKKNGQPYIFLLFHLKYPPEKYQKQASLSPPDEYGFGQVESFDKFIFTFKTHKELKNTAIIGYPDDFPEDTGEYNIDMNKIKKIKVGTEDIFWIYEYPST